MVLGRTFLRNTKQVSLNSRVVMSDIDVLINFLQPIHIGTKCEYEKFDKFRDQFHVTLCEFSLADYSSKTMLNSWSERETSEQGE